MYCGKGKVLFAYLGFGHFYHASLRTNSSEMAGKTKKEMQLFLQTQTQVLNGKLQWKLRRGICPVGRFTELPLLKMRVQSMRWRALRDDGELASPRRGEAKRIGELHPFKIYSYFFSLSLWKAYPSFWAWFVLILNSSLILALFE